MKLNQVISIVKFYRDIDSAVRLNERVIKNLQDQYYNTLGAVNMDGMPHGKGSVSSSVERTALNIPASVAVTIDSLERENTKLAQLKAAILSELNSLTYTQRAIVLAFYVEGQQWEQVAGQIHYSPRQCRNIRNEALRLLGQRIEGNAALYDTLKGCGFGEGSEG